MLFNVDNCKTLHVGHNNPRHNYQINNITVQQIDEEQDLGVKIHHPMKVAQQVGAAVKQANQLLGILKCTCDYKEKKVQLYKSLVRPYMDYCIHEWRLHFQKDIAALEKVQHRATKIIPELSHLPYQERLKTTGLLILKTRHDRAYLTETFKILNKFEDVDPDIFFSSDVTQTWSNGFKLNQPQSRTENRCFYIHRVINSWNRLPDEAVTSKTVLS
ncbi:uncharacterized protein [Procambarus clarkii]|uniref:uncharacterized protein n=1 Tax=Procambarus clarkii TaxID=6728 RepID=UPI0037424850